MNISQISRPGPGQTITLHAAASDKIIFGFSTEGITLSRDDSALIFTFDDGAAVRLDDFYKNYHADNIPEFETEGRLISGAEFFSALGPDLMPAAGPASVERSSHSVAYGDSSLLGGVDHLDGLDMSVQGKSAADGGLQFDSALTADRGADFGGSPTPTPTPAPTPEPPLFPSGPFVRAVLYSPGNLSDPVTTTVFFGGNGTSPAAVAPGDIDFAGSAPGAQYGVTVSLPAGWSSSWVDVSFNSTTGRLEFRLTADGVDEMQRLGLEGESLVDFVHVTVTDRTSGDTFEYNVEFVATDSQIFDSAAHDSKYGGEHLDNIGEFHQGQNNGGSYSVISSMQDDEIIMNETVIGGSSIHASGSADPAHMADDFNTIKLNAGVVNTTQDSITHITSTDGTLDVADGVSVQASGAENVIDMGKGSIHVQNGSGDGVSAADGGKNTVSGGDVTVDAGDKGLFAKNGGSNTVGAQNGDVSIDAGAWAIIAQDNAANSVAATGGSVNITSGGQALNARSGSVNSVTTTDGDITINATWEGVATHDNSTNNLSATNGSVSIKTDTWGISSSGNSSANVDVTNGNLEIDAIGRGIHSYGSSTDDGSVNGYSTNTVSVTNGDVNINAGRGWEGLMAHFGGVNNIDVAGGSASINAKSTGVFSYKQSANNLTIADGSLTINAGYIGVRAEESSVNTVAVTDGDISIQAVSDIQRADGLAAVRGGSNVLSAAGGTVSVAAHSGPGAAVGMGADANGVNGVAAGNRITAGEVTVSSSSDSSWTIGMYAANNNTVNQAENSIDTTGAAARGQSGTVSVHANWDAQSGPSGSYEAHALAAYGKNTVNRITADGDVDIKAGSSGNVATGLISRYESDNVIDGQKDIGVSAVSTAHQAAGLRVDTGGHNSLIAKGTVDISATGSTASGMAVASLSGPGYLVSGSNTITSDEKTTITATAAGSASGSNAYGMVINYSTGNDGDASNTVTSGGNVAINSSSASGKAYGMAVLSSGTATATAANTITADGRVDVNATGNVASAMYATGAQASNSIATTGGGVTVSAVGTGSGIGNGFGYGMSAMSGGNNTITTEGGHVSVSGSGSSGFGMVAKAGGVNAIESAINSPLTVTITASANAAEKAIAMWADGGGSVNRITGHSQSGGAGDSITLTGGVAMQTANGGRNIITTGAGDDHVTINGAVKGSGNQINMGEGSNTVTLNGVIEAGSLNVLVDSGGTYTLILQESGVESFADRYGDWLDNIVTNNLFSGLSSIHFEGWGEDAQSAEYLAEFMASFEGLLDTLYNAGVAIEPPALLDYLTNPNPAASPAALLVETGVEHHMQDAQDAQHAATGHDDTQDSPLAVHDGPVFMTGDGSEEPTFSAQANNTEAHAGIVAPDSSAQPGLDAGEHEVETAQPLFAFLNAPAAGAHADMPAYEGDESLHNGYLDNGECEDGIAGLHAAISLTPGGESLDSLFADVTQRIEENGEASLWYVESDVEMHDVGLTNMNTILVQNGAGEQAADAPKVAFDVFSFAGERALSPHEAGSAPSLMDHSQEATDSAIREMANG